VFTSGPSQGPSPCPTLSGNGFVAASVSLDANVTAPNGQTVAHGNWPFPDEAGSEAVQLPANAVPGTYTAHELCSYYGPGRGPADAIFGYAATSFTVSSASKSSASRTHS
jgi:hypothetical protein